MRILKHISEIPDWFVLDKYDAAKLFDLDDWYHELLIRYLTYSLISDAGPDDNTSEWSRGIRERGIAPRRLDVKLERMIEAGKRLNGGHSARKMIVYPFQIMDATTARDLLSKDKDIIKAESEWSDAINNVSPSMEWPEMPEILDKPYDEYLYERYPGTRDFILRVDLNASDESLIEAFKETLKDARSRLGRHAKERKFSAAELASWNRARILPFLDLYYWAIENQLKIPDWLMGDAIFSDRYDIDRTEAVRKTTKPKALELLTGDKLNILQNEAEIVCEENFRLAGENLEAYKAKYFPE